MDGVLSEGVLPEGVLSGGRFVRAPRKYSTSLIFGFVKKQVNTITYIL